MEDTLQLILKKLDNIEGRLKTVETGPSVKSSQPDPLFQKAVKIIGEIDKEISTSEMQKRLGTDFKTAEKILDKLAEAGFGETYMGEA